MSDQDNLGRLDDDQEAEEPSSTTDGPAADGEYDARQGSPDSGPHAVGEAHTDETADTRSQQGPSD